MRAFRYDRPVAIAEAAAAVRGCPDTMFLGGGTNLVDLIRLGVERPAALVDVTRLGLDQVAETADGGLRIGATVRNSDLAAHAVVRTRFPALARALLAGASGQLRNMATTAGNLLQRTRCPYFQHTDKPCNKRVPGSGCPARDGEHRDLAILGHSQACVATHPSDLAVALAALDAEVEVRDGGGERRIPVTALYRQPGAEPHRDTVLAHGDLVTAVHVPASACAAHSTYAKVRDRASYAFAVASVAAGVDVADGRIRDVRLAFGAVAPMPWRARVAEDALRGAEPSERVIGAALDAELAAARPLRDNAFKVPLTRRLAVRTLLDLAAADGPA